MAHGGCGVVGLEPTRYLLDLSDAWLGLADDGAIYQVEPHGERAF